MVTRINTGRIVGSVIDVGQSRTKREQTHNPVVDAKVEVYGAADADKGPTGPARTINTDLEGNFTIENLAAGEYQVTCDAFLSQKIKVDVVAGEAAVAHFKIPLGLRLTSRMPKRDDNTALVPCEEVTAGTPVTLTAEYNEKISTNRDINVKWATDRGKLIECESRNERVLITDGVSGLIHASVTFSHNPSVTAVAPITVVPVAAQPISGQVGVTLQRSRVPPTGDLPLWATIRGHSKAMSFGGLGVPNPAGVRIGSGYHGFIDQVLCGDVNRLTARPDKCGPTAEDMRELAIERNRPLHGVAAYDLLKTATEIFLLWNCGVALRRTDALGNPIITDEDEFGRSGLTVDEIETRLTDYLGPGRLPYIRRIVQTVFPGGLIAGSIFCTGLTSKVDCTCLIELIWSYWHEEGMLAQTLNAISRRFQNLRAPGDRDPLAHLEIDPLRPLNSLLWGYIQDEQNRLTVRRRAYEYDHHYGLTIYGKAVPTLRPADSRSKFLEAFHNLLHRCSLFYKEDNDTTVIADGFPLLNALKEVHLLLAQGAHNQFGDLPWTARVEMLTQQWLLARPEIREFLQSRPMVPYLEAWMPPVDTMKTLQGWSDVTITHFRDLGVYGEQILLTIRYGDWIGVNDENSATNWARYWRPEIQGYLHAYRAVTGVDLTNPDTVDHRMPAVHLQKRLAAQRVR
jgi:hypothetical protein